MNGVLFGADKDSDTYSAFPGGPGSAPP